MSAFVIENLGWIGLAVLAVVAALLFRQNGKEAARSEQAAAEKRARDIADEEQAGVDAMPSDEAREELKRWSKH